MITPFAPSMIILSISKKIWQTICFSLILVGLLLQGCGSETTVVTQWPPEISNVSATQQESPPPSDPTEIILVEPTLLLSETRSLNTDNYWIAWKDPNLGYIAASRSGVPVTVPNYPPSAGSSLLTSHRSVSLVDQGTAFPEIFTPNGDPLADENSCSQECASVEILEVDMPAVTNDYTLEDLIIKAVAYDALGNPLSDLSVIFIEITEDEYGWVGNPRWGFADASGNFSTTAQLLKNLGTTTFEIEAECGRFTDQKTQSMTDPCNDDDPFRWTATGVGLDNTGHCVENLSEIVRTNQGSPCPKGVPHYERYSLPPIEYLYETDCPSRVALGFCGHVPGPNGGTRGHIGSPNPLAYWVSVDVEIECVP